MDEARTAHLRRHLLAAHAVGRAASPRSVADLVRSRGTGNGVRIHAVYFAAVSLAALLMIVAGISFAATR